MVSSTQSVYLLMKYDGSDDQSHNDLSGSETPGTH